MKRTHGPKVVAVLIVVFFAVLTAIGMQGGFNLEPLKSPAKNDTPPATRQIDSLVVKGRAPKTGYSRSQFGDGWAMAYGGCSMREAILRRDLESVVLDGCKVKEGVLNDPYTGRVVQFSRGIETSQEVQIDHVVALSNAWQTGAQQLSQDEREAFANDPMGLLAVEGVANRQKSDGDAATWLPPNKVFRCRYVAKQVAIKAKYHLWVTSAEKRAMLKVLTSC